MAIIDSTQMMFTAFEPKLQNRFLMNIDGIDSYLIKKISRPTISFGEIVLDHINVKRKIKGKANWENISCELYDPITPSGAQSVMEWVRLSHESVTGRDGYSDFYKKDIHIQTLGPVGPATQIVHIVEGCIPDKKTFTDKFGNTVSPIGAGTG